MDEKFRRRVEAAVATVQTWDKDVDLLRECYRQIPMDVLRPKRNNHDADDAVDEYSHVNDVELSPTARFVQRLARYFQKRMTWIQTPSCVQCGNSSNDDTTTNPRHSHMEGKGIRGPLTASEIQGEAHRVEVYVCQTCGTETVFPRYNAVRTLLQQHAGRCGEYANLFGLYCRSVGLETRYILDCTDHVWTEVRIGDCGGDGDGWCMVDSCEGVLDENSMYEAGWGKQLSCIVAVSLHQVVDVTPKYTRLWNDADFVARRRAVTSSEESGIRILQHINQRLLLQLSPKEQEQLTRRSAREATLLQHEMRQTFWDHQYGRGRISGSLTWKVSRHEAGKDSSAQDDPPPQQRTVPCHFHVETYYCYYYQNFPTRSAANANTTTTTMLEIVLQAAPCTRHEAVIVNGVACAVGAMNSLSLVVLDEVHFGGILQSRCFQRLVDLADFVTTLPAQRIVAVVGRLPISQDNNDDDAAAVAAANRLSHELPGFQVPLVTAGILYLGQVLVRPDWTYCGSYKDVPRHGVCWKTSPKTCQSLGDVVARRKQKLWTVRNVQPARVTGRVPDSIMPLATQQVAGYEQKRAAFLALVETTTGSDCAGYTTKPGSPIYLLGATAYPFARDDRSEHGWNTFLLVPEELVPDDDVGLLDAPLSTTTTPQYEVPLDASFFVRSFGSHVLTGGNERIPTADALQNTRLVGVYFSAHWCGPCRSFTPVLTEMYELLKESYPTHGLEIVFVSSDRDAGEFNQYFASMPWLAVPFESIGLYKQLLSATYNIRGIPSLIILDSVSGQIVVSLDEARQQVMQTCRRGDEAIRSMFETHWLDRVPLESKQLLEMLQRSCAGDVGRNEETPNVSPLQTSYLIRKESREKEARFQALVAQLLDEGMELEEATEAATAVEEVTFEEKRVDEDLEAGPLNGLFWRTLLADSMKMTSSEWATRVLKESGREQLGTVLSTARKYLTNCIKSHCNPKFRNFQLSFKAADAMTRVPGGLQLLQSLGFEIYGNAEDFVACIPVYADLDAMYAELSSLHTQYTSS